MRNVNQHSNAWKSVITMLVAVPVTTLWFSCPQKALANSEPANATTQNRTEDINTYLLKEHRCNYLPKLRSRLSIVSDDLVLNSDILQRLRILYEAGAVSELSYIYQRQDVLYLANEQVKLNVLIAQLESQADQSGCLFRVTIDRYDPRYERQDRPSATILTPSVIPVERDNLN